MTYAVKTLSFNLHIIDFDISRSEVTLEKISLLISNDSRMLEKQS